MIYSEIKSVKSRIFKDLIETLRGVIRDANFIFQENSLRICNFNRTKQVLVICDLFAEQFEKYTCRQDKTVLGLHLEKLFKVLKTTNTNDVFWMYYDTDTPKEISIRMENAQKGTMRKFQIPILMDTPMIQYHVPDVEFDYVVELDTQDVQKMAKDFHALNFEKVEICCMDDHLVFKSEDGLIKSYEVVFTQKKEGKVDTRVVFETNSGIISQGTYPLKYILDFTKATSLCQRMKIYIKNDHPLIVEYQVANLGKLQFVLSQEVNGTPAA